MIEEIDCARVWKSFSWLRGIVEKVFVKQARPAVHEYTAGVRQGQVSEVFGTKLEDALDGSVQAFDWVWTACNPRRCYHPQSQSNRKSFLVVAVVFHWICFDLSVDADASFRAVAAHL